MQLPKHAAQETVALPKLCPGNDFPAKGSDGFFQPYPRTELRDHLIHSVPCNILISRKKNIPKHIRAFLPE